MENKKDKYNYKFKVNKSRYERFVPSITSTFIRSWRDIIEDYIEISRKRKDNKLAMFYLQKNLLSDIIGCENSIKRYKEILRNPDIAKKELPEGAIINDEQIELWKNEIEENKLLITIFKVYTQKWNLAY